MKVALASDHAGFALKTELITWLKSLEYQILDFGTYSDESVDYPDFAFPASEAVAAGIADFGVFICGTGTGMNITANKVIGIRAANCLNLEMARMARMHNNANVLTLGSRLISVELAKEIVKEFMESEFEGGRHMIRIEKIHAMTEN